MRKKLCSVAGKVLILAAIFIVAPQLAQSATIVTVESGGSFQPIGGFQFSILTPSGTLASAFTPSSLVSSTLGWNNGSSGSVVAYFDFSGSSSLPLGQNQVGSFANDVTLGNWVFTNNTTGFSIPSSNYSVSQIGTNYLVSPVPIPAAAWLLGSGLVGLVALKRRKRA